MSKFTTKQRLSETASLAFVVSNFTEDDIEPSNTPQEVDEALSDLRYHMLEAIACIHDLRRPTMEKDR